MKSADSSQADRQTQWQTDKQYWSHKRIGGGNKSITDITLFDGWSTVLYSSRIDINDSLTRETEVVADSSSLYMDGIRIHNI